MVVDTKINVRGVENNVHNFYYRIKDFYLLESHIKRNFNHVIIDKDKFEPTKLKVNKVLSQSRLDEIVKIN